MPYELITTKELFQGQIIEIVLGPAPGNIVTRKLADEFAAELDRIAAEPRAKLIVVSGEGKHFSYGASVEEHKPDQVGDMLPRFHALIRKLLDCGVPTLAKVSGACLGGGFEIAMACSMLFCNEKAKFALPEIQLGVFPPPACLILPFKVGAAAANEMILTGRQFSATELQRFGMVNQLTAIGELDAGVNDFIEKQIIPKSASSLRFACDAARRSILQHYHTHIGDLEDLYLLKLMGTDDAREGIQAFLEKRTPVWTEG
jgi:cyclohexa-1,5-dienecarbonyl-CoA hydratase